MAQDPTTIKGIEQGRAKFAYDAVKTVNEVEGLKEKEAKRFKGSYKSAAKKLPVLIKTNGLGQTLAFVKSKRAKKGKPKNGYDKLYEQIGKWFNTKDAKGFPESSDFVKQVIELESSNYRQVTIETLALLNWMRRFVEGVMKDVADAEQVEESD